jgi:dihydroorotase
MKLIIRDAKIIDSKSPFHNKTVDILIVDGFIKKMGTSLPNQDKADEIQLDNLHVSQGWFDSSVSLGEPGYEDSITTKLLP